MSVKAKTRWYSEHDKGAQKEQQQRESVGDQSPSPEAPPRSKRGGTKGDVMRATTRGVMEKSWGHLEEVNGDDPFKYFFIMGSQKYLLRL